MKRFVPTPGAMKLLLEGTQSLSEIEQTGIRINKEYLESALDFTAAQIKELESQIRADPDYKHWWRKYGTSTNLTSATQMAGVVFGEMGFKSKVRTKKDTRASASEKALEGIDVPLVKKYLEAQHIRKARDTFLMGIYTELVQHDDGLWYCHPYFNMNRTGSFRSSSSSPNFQNLPVRNPVMADVVRRCIVPRPGNQILEIDYGQIEVRIPTSYSHDPNLIEYCCDPTKDMHKEVECQLFMMDPNKHHTKQARHLAKNQGVFPFFYGSYYAQVSRNIWEMLDIYNLKLGDGSKTIKQHLADNGITELGTCDPDQEPKPGTFERHVRDIEDDFWRKRFPVHNQWRRDWIRDYHENGGCQFLTGYVMTGPHKRNDITSYAIQCDAFQCMLWSLPRINEKLRKYKMKTRVICEIHDSVEFDCCPTERDDVIEIATTIMTRDIKKWMTWLPVPLVCEVEACPIDASWLEKHQLVDSPKGWVPKSLSEWEQKHGSWSLQG